MISLKERFNEVCHDYIFDFCNKQDVAFVGWVADRVGEIALFNNDMAFNFTDITTDIDSDLPKGLIFQWMNDSIDNVDYLSYSQRLRFTDV